MVVRSLAGSDFNGLAIDLEKPSAEWSFELTGISNGLKKYLDDYEKRPRPTPYSFVDKKSTIGPSNLSVIAYVQEEQSKKVLQAMYVKVKP
jgi:hypothetical protein